MKRFWLFFILQCGVFSLLAQSDHTADSPYRALVEGSWAWTLGAEVSVYTGPDTQAVLCTTLLAASPIQLLERLDETEKRQGFRTNWYRIRYANANPRNTGEGFLWGGDIALQCLRTCASSLQLTYGLEKIRLVQRGNYQEPQLELALITKRQGQIINKTTVLAVGSIYTQVQARLRGDQEIAGNTQVLELAFSDGYCGGVAATITLLWDGQKWHQLEVLSQGFGKNRFSNAYYKYPKEHNKGSNIIELHREEGYYNKQQQAVYTKQQVEIYEWTGRELLKVEG